MTYQQRVALDELMRGAPLDVGGDVSEQRAIFAQLVAAEPLAHDVVASSRDIDGVSVMDVSIRGLSGERTILPRVGDFLNRHLASSEARSHSPQDEPGPLSSASAEKRRS